MDVLSPALRRISGRISLPPALLPLAGAALASVLYARLLLDRADELRLRAYDTAFFEQVAWNLGHGGGFSGGGFFGSNFLGLHFSPLLALPAALELAWPDVRVLGLVHAAAVASTAPAAYLFFRALLEGRPRAALAAAALSTPIPFWAALQQAVRAGFHPEALGLTLVLLAGWAGLRGRVLLSCALALAALGAREDQAYGVAVIGLLLLAVARTRRSRWLGLGLGAGGVACGILVELVLMPALRESAPDPLADYYRWLAQAPPGAVLAALAQPEGWLAFGGLVLGLAGLPLLRPRWLALALPPFLGDLLSAHFPQPELWLQYGLPLMAPVLVAGGLGARRVLGDPRPVAAVLALGAPALLVAVALSPLLGLPTAVASDPDVSAPTGSSPGASAPAASAASLGRLGACTVRLPARAPVAADDDVAAPLAARPLVRLLPAAQPGDFVVVDRAGATPAYWAPGARASALEALPGQGRALLCDDGRFQLWGPAHRAR